MKLGPSINLASRKKRVFAFLAIVGGGALILYLIIHFLHRGSDDAAATAGNAPVQFVPIKDSQFTTDDAVSATEEEQSEIADLKQQVSDLKAQQQQQGTTESQAEQQEMNNLQQQLISVEQAKNQQGNTNNIPVPPSPINSFSLSFNAPPVNNGTTVQNYVPSNTWAKAILIQGVDADAAVTGQSNTTPVVFQIIQDGTGPNNTTYPLKGCRVSGEAYGDISSERAEIRLVSLSCVRKDGSILDIPVKGYVADDGGKEGIRGYPVMRNGAILFNAGVSGFMSGIGQSLQQGMQTQSVSPLGTTSTVNSNQTLQYGMLGGGSTAMNQLASYYIQRAEQYHPIIQVNSGSAVDVVFLDGFSIIPKIQNTPTTGAVTNNTNPSGSPFAPATFNLNGAQASSMQPVSIQNAESIMKQVSQAQFGQTIGVTGS